MNPDDPAAVGAFSRAMNARRRRESSCGGNRGRGLILVRPSLEYDCPCVNRRAAAEEAVQAWLFLDAQENRFSFPDLQFTFLMLMTLNNFLFIYLLDKVCECLLVAKLVERRQHWKR